MQFSDGKAVLPPRFADIKREIADSIPDFEQRVTRAWTDVIGELASKTTEIAHTGPEFVPQISFADLNTLSDDQLLNIKRRGCVVIKDVVDDAEAASWKTALREYIANNPGVEGFPPEDKQFFQLFWTRSQVAARSHPNVLAASAWLNNLYHIKAGTAVENVNLSVPLSYADRFRIRNPGVQWDVHPPHVDGGTIERWENETFRKCFAEILEGKWREHDAYDLANRVNARTSLYGRANQASVFRTFQGWLAMSETAPSEGTLRVFPDVLLSNAYIILRPFVRQKSTPVTADPLDAENWEYDISTSDFPGIAPRDNGYVGPRPTPESHPHLRLDETMTSVPKVNPGDMVFWHCDLIHSVELEHNGVSDSSVMYIPAVPYTEQNASYVARQKEAFLQGRAPPDFQASSSEAAFIGGGREADLLSEEGRRAMGFGLQVGA